MLDPTDSDLPTPDNRLAGLSWTERALRGGELLWRSGEPADELAWVLEGELVVEADRGELGRVGPGGLVGEAGVFISGETRLADVRARVPTRLRVLDEQALLGARGDDPEGYEALLLAALGAISERIEGADEEITARAGWQFDALRARTRAEDWRLGTTEASVDEAEALQALSSLPGFDHWDETESRAVLARVASMVLRDGEALCREGDPGGSFFIVVSGQLQVLRSLGDEALVLGTAGAGSILGTAALEAGRRRAASLVADGEVVVLRIDRAVLPTLDWPARRAVLESLLVTTRAQLAEANAGALRSRGSKSAVTMEDAISSLAWLNGWAVAGPGTQVELTALPTPATVSAPDAESAALLDTIRESIIGGDVALPTPFGLKRVVYADYTASGRSLTFIEDFLRERVMPLYANTHSEASASGLQTTHFREEARAIVADAVGATAEDAVVFTGAGATAAINKLVGILNLAVPEDLDREHGLTDSIPAAQRPVVFVGPYEHHSNILPWKHTIADVEILPLDADGGIDLEVLESLLVRYSERPLRIGSFSAASNVTGMKTDTVAIATLLHRHGALSFWDYAGAGPYVKIEMNPSGEGIDSALAHKDAIFLSPHKFIGGPGTPGLLIVKRELVRNTVPTQPGGGSVDFVTWVQSLYADEIEIREEAGTPAILESIRCGLAFQLKEQVGAELIEHMEESYTRAAMASWTANPALRIVGNPDADRLSITAFLVRYGEMFVHHGFVVSLLNDLFGVQARGGCSCAGPYGSMLLGLSPSTGQMFLDRAEEGWFSLKPGWSRVNLNYFIGDAEFRYIVGAVHLVAIYGWALMPRYDFDPTSGLWTHRDGNPYRPAHLSDLRFDGAAPTWKGSYRALPPSALDRQLSEGRQVLLAAVEDRPAALPAPELPQEYEDARWFPLPHEVAAWMRDRPEASTSPRAADEVRRRAYAEALRRADSQGVSAGLRRILGVTPEEHARFVREAAR